MRHDLSQTGLAEADLTRLRGVFAGCAAVEEVVLFGSRAKGTAAHGSDIDLALKGRALKTHDLLALANDLDDLLLPYKIDLVLYAQIDNQPLREHVERVGIVLFSRESG